MTDALILTDQTINTVLEGKKPALILVTTGDGLRGDFMSAFKKAAQQNTALVFARLDPLQNSAAAARLNVSGDKPVLIGWYNGAEVTRRSKPWGTDVPLAIEMLQNAAKPQGQPQPAAPAAQVNSIQKRKDKQVTDKATNGSGTTINGQAQKPDLAAINGGAASPIANNKPINVTQETFEDIVLNSELPVLVDFWAEWCGPCRMVAPILEKLAAEFAGQVRIAKVNVDEQPALGAAFQARSIPLLVAIKQRVVVYNQPGALPEPMMRDLVSQLIALEIPPEALAQVEAQMASQRSSASQRDAQRGGANANAVDEAPE